MNLKTISLKRLLFTTLTLFVIQISNSQSDFRIGVKGGANISLLESDYIDALDPKISYHIGGLVEIPLSGKFSIQPEVIYSRQGTKQNSFFGDYDSRVKLDYINIPVIVKFYIIKGLSAELGPQLGYLVSAKTKYESKDISEENNVEDLYTSIDFSIGFGVSYRFTNGVFFNIRFNKGISNISKYEEFGNYEDGDVYLYSNKNKIRNNVLQLSTGYSF